MTNSDKIWYLKINDRESGPYDYNELCHFIHWDELSLEHQITLLGEGNWTPLGEHPLFSAEKRKTCLENYHLDQDTNYLRKSLRLPVFAELALIKSHLLYKAASLEMSTGGGLIHTPRGALKINDEFRIHIYANPKLKIPSLNLKAQCVRSFPISKDYTGELFGVQFLDLKPKTKEQLKEFLRVCIINKDLVPNIRKVVDIKKPNQNLNTAKVPEKIKVF